ncbi:transmembrane protein 121B [Hippoglossus stenolepis]|uniref:transmembrane protein 121B n=2 Tax=Hippoglossus TaxID=8266 RepID=UPI00159BF975|nr:transmembrane protein 121B [Hippoglossus stenolepis]
MLEASLVHSSCLGPRLSLRMSLPPPWKASGRKERRRKGGERTNTMVSETGNDNLKADYLQYEASYSPDSSSPEAGQLSRRRDTQTTSGSINPEESGSIRPLVSSAAAASCIMTSGEFMQSAPLLAHRTKRSLLYKALCFLLLVFQGGVLDFYLIIFTDLYWCSWIATDLVVISGWGIFFMKNARSKRERACGFHQKGSIFGCNLGEFTYAYLAWLIYVIACTPKVVLILETSILDLVALKVPCGATGFKIVVLLSAPLLYCLINSIIEDLNGATRHHSHSCFLGTCLDLLDSFTLLEMLLRREIPTAYLKYTVISVYFVALAVPVVWLYALTASELRCRWLWARFATGLLVNAPLLVVRCFQVYVYEMPVSVFMFKNIFFLACALLELVEQCAAVRGVRRLAGGSNTAQFSHCVSENDMCPHGYVNTLAVTQS